MAEAERFDKRHFCIRLGNHFAHEVFARDANVHLPLPEQFGDLAGRKIGDFDARQIANGSAIVACAARLYEVETCAGEVCGRILLQAALGRYRNHEGGVHGTPPQAASRRPPRVSIFRLWPGPAGIGARHAAWALEDWLRPWSGRGIRPARDRRNRPVRISVAGRPCIGQNQREAGLIRGLPVGLSIDRDLPRADRRRGRADDVAVRVERGEQQRPGQRVCGRFVSRGKECQNVRSNFGETQRPAG